MEFLPKANAKMIKQVVELVPGSLYWAAVDIGLYSVYLKSEGIDSVGKPNSKLSVPSNILTKPIPKEDPDSCIENMDSNVTPRKQRRTTSNCNTAKKKLAVPRIVYTDKVFVYHPLGRDFGPLDLSTTYRYINFIDDQFGAGLSSVVIHVCDFRKSVLCSNSAYLASVYATVRFGVTFEEIGRKFSSVSLITPFRDASMNPANTFPVSIENCCEAFSMSLKHNWCDWSNFDVEKTEHFQHVDHGDLNWIFENKLLAFAGPSTDCLDEDGLEVHPPSHYVSIFKSMNITDVVRLNVPNYDADEFASNGIDHHSMFFEDGSCPPMKTVNAFLKLMDNKKNPVAVHCKAGLGRSACMIGIWAMRHYQISALTFIAWARIARPGSVLGPQQHFLVELENSLWKPGRVMMHKSQSALVGSLSPMGLHGDHGQGSRLLKQKRSAAVLMPF